MVPGSWAVPPKVQRLECGSGSLSVRRGLAVPGAAAAGMLCP